MVQMAQLDHPRQWQNWREVKLENVRLLRYKQLEIFDCTVGVLLHRIRTVQRRNTAEHLSPHNPLSSRTNTIPLKGRFYRRKQVANEAAEAFYTPFDPETCTSPNLTFISILQVFDNREWSAFHFVPCFVVAKAGTSGDWDQFQLGLTPMGPGCNWGPLELRPAATGN